MSMIPPPLTGAPIRADGALSLPARTLTVEVGQVLAARVIDVDSDQGTVRLAIAGGQMLATGGSQLRPGDLLRLGVTEASGQRILLSPLPAQAAGAAGAVPAADAALAARLQATGLSARVAGTLAAVLAPDGGPAVDIDPAALGARAQEAQVGTSPARALAFARLVAAGLPTPPATVAGLGELLTGAPLGRTLAGIAEALRGSTLPAAPPAPTASPLLAPAASEADVAPPRSGALPAGGSDRPSGATTAVPARESSAGGPRVGGGAGTTGVAGSSTTIAASFAALLERIGDGAVRGDGEGLRAAILALGAHTGRGTAGVERPEATLRTLLLSIADASAGDTPLARSASLTAQAIGAQTPAGPAAGAPLGLPALNEGLYLQLPLPDGGSAQVRIARRDRGDDEAGAPGGRARDVAVLLDLSALGPVLITARTGDGPVDARVRVEREDSRAFLARQADALARALNATGESAACVRVEAVPQAPPRSLLAPPPTVGLDRRA
ncbi:MAG TPA: hypothetical protein PKE32_00145 [Miltoncostaeaceae bacterium]|nr:hypothetical protein [Miltoncostaeaceae bacterium]